MRIVLILFSAIFAIWGILVVNHDINTCKIKNTSIIAGIKLTALFLAIHVFFTVVASNPWLIKNIPIDTGLTPAFYIAYLLHCFLAAAFAILLWYADSWPAGDAKFFIVVASIIPLLNPNVAGFPTKTFFYFMINVFVAASFWAFGTFFLSGLQKMDRRYFFDGVYYNFLNEINRLKQKYKGWQLIFVLSGMLVFFLLQRTLSLTVRLAAAKLVSDPAVMLFLLFMLWDKIAPLFQKKGWIIFSAIFYASFVVLGYIYFPDKLIELAETAFIDALKLSVLIVLLRRFAVFLMEQADLQLLYAEQLRPGMILSEKSREIVKGDPNFDGDSFIKEGLTQLQVNILKDNAMKIRNKVPDFKFEVIKGRPFAGWIFLGAIITLIFKQNIAILLFR